MPIHLPFDPETHLAPGEAGWLWTRTPGETGPRWHLVALHDDYPTRTIRFLTRAAGGADLFDDADGWAGLPFMPCAPPVIEPGQDDGALIVCHIGPGQTLSHSYPPGDDAQAALDAVTGGLLAMPGARTITEGG